MILQEFLLSDVTVNFDRQRKPIKAAERTAGPYPYYGASGIVDKVAGYLFDGEYLLVAEDGENLRTRKTPIAMIATGKFWANNHAHVLQGNELANTYYLAYAIEQLDISGYLTGSTQPKLTQSALNSIRLSLPSKINQDAITKIVRTLDRKIAGNDHIATTSRNLGVALYQSSINESFQVKSIGEISEVLTRGQAPKYTDDPSGIAVINQKCVRGGRVTPEPARLAEADRVKQDRILQRHDVLVNSTGVGTLGRVGIWSQNLTATADSHVTIIRMIPQIPAIVGGFAILAAQPQIESLGEGSTGQTELGRTKLASLPIRIPSSNTEGLAQRLSNLEDRADAALSESRALAELRDALLPELMSGRLRVKDAEKVVEEAV
ncbi:restriction endonuclease subunit S [Solwaraspora sp. WMMA2056]|uniref:restriction endonuclease subunit S n=1 Tax=Solwaraspora sp. WMMA2056 TaxID=3015161 RepID=UPI00259B683B|nr:restriction endonuclease subunit S [Solwaraspora sp. WMMA2056]WJK41433.1 restriction endonuclease subunit S [Solwaraspora sp. WMMA2056]